MRNGAFPFIIPCDKIKYSMEFYSPPGLGCHAQCMGQQKGKHI